MYITDDVYGFFDQQSEIYNNFRPEYPDEIFDYILDAIAATASSSLGNLRTINGSAWILLAELVASQESWLHFSIEYADMIVANRNCRQQKNTFCQT